MTTPTFDLTPFLNRDEGQHFDRKSMFEGEEGKVHPRELRNERNPMAEDDARKTWEEMEGDEA
jgi:ATP-dependent DNA helicase RecG